MDNTQKPSKRGRLKDRHARGRVLSLLDGGQVKSVKELMLGAGLRTRNAADALLFKLVRAGLVEGAGTGRYQIRRAA